VRGEGVAVIEPAGAVNSSGAEHWSVPGDEDENWQDTYFKGWKKLKRLLKNPKD